MSNLSAIPRNLALALCIIPFLAACGEKSSEAPTQTKVISQKITISKEGGTAPEKPIEDAAVVPAPAPAPTPSAQPAEGTVTPSEIQTGETEVETQDPISRITYNFEGKVDPFAPLFQEQPEKVVGPEASTPDEVEGRLVQKSEVVRQIPKTPLEEIDISQLKLVAIIRSDQGNRAMVQDASGKGYVLNTGTYIGINSGFVTEITPDKVIIEEVARDIVRTDGLVKLRKRELELQKPVGEI